MTSKFEMRVIQLLKNFNSQREFNHNVTLCSKFQQVIIFDSRVCKIALYKSLSNGEVNCKIGKINAVSNDIGGADWFFLNALINDAEDLSEEELLEAVPSIPKSFDE